MKGQMRGTYLHGVQGGSSMYSNERLTAIVPAAASGWRQQKGGVEVEVVVVMVGGGAAQP